MFATPAMPAHPFQPIQSFDLTDDMLPDPLPYSGAMELPAQAPPLGTVILSVDSAQQIDVGLAAQAFLPPAPVVPEIPIKRRRRKTSPATSSVPAEMALSETVKPRNRLAKQHIRKLKNRASAARSREKAIHRQHLIEQSLMELQRQNSQLREMIITMAQATGQPIPVLPAVEMPDDLSDSSSAAFIV
ncbi:hypothetical protein P43SY_003167 [Pythium insidiosum]|uniref:BZIP domain-containing protein n=1 Tax=Pythium insidiosum TaxID=114742 RepID=A0AAD5LEL0_PYTIN|nr:hypothetical protein P43SY_003167 [Pythium insidiosum]